METRTYNDITAPNVYSDEFNDIKREREIMSKELSETKFMMAERMKDGLTQEILKALKEQEEINRNKELKARKNKENFITRFLKKLNTICQ